MRRPELLCRIAALRPAFGRALPVAGGNIYCCEDASERTVCGDVLPASVTGVRIARSVRKGIVRRVVAAPGMTAAELARQREEDVAPAARGRAPANRTPARQGLARDLWRTWTTSRCSKRRAGARSRARYRRCAQRETELRQARVAPGPRGRVLCAPADAAETRQGPCARTARATRPEERHRFEAASVGGDPRPLRRRPPALPGNSRATAAAQPLPGTGESASALPYPGI